MLDTASGNNTAQQRDTVNRVIRVYRIGEYYEVLGFTPPYNKNETKSAYYITAKLFHPNKSGDEDANDGMKSRFRG